MSQNAEILQQLSDERKAVLKPTPVPDAPVAPADKKPSRITRSATVPPAPVAPSEEALTEKQ